MDAQLFLLLPEYCDKPGGTRFFLETTTLKDDKEMTEFLGVLNEMVSYLRHEDLVFYYDSDNLKAFVRPLDVMPEEYPDKKRYLKELVQRSMSNWRDASVMENSDRFEYLQREISDNTLCEVAKRKTDDGDIFYIVVNHEALTTVSGDIESLEVRVNGTATAFPVIRLEVSLLLKWLIANGVAKRNYLPNTDKHGGNGLGGSEAANASKLLCSDKKAEEMMLKAVKVKKHLFYFDEEERLYVKFMSGNNNTYHPYHITSAQDEQKNVPDEAKKALRLHLGKFKSRYE